jgi:hypothetical protein
MVRGIITMGRADAQQWITSYSVTAYIGMRNFSMYDERTGAEYFEANWDSSTQVTRIFRVPTEMR